MWRGWCCAGRRRRPAWSLSLPPRLGRHQPGRAGARRRQRWADAGRHRWRGHGRDPVHQWLHRRAQGRGLPPPPFRRPDPAAGQCLRHGSGRGGPADLPAVCLVRPGAGPDLGDPGHGPDAAGAGRPGTPARCHPALRRDPAVWFARADAGAGEAWPAAADGDPGDLGRCTGAAGRGRHHPQPAAGRRAVLDAVRRHRVPAGGSGGGS